MNKIQIFSVNDTFDLKQCTLGTPGRLQGGSYYSKMFYNKDALYFRMNDIYTKQGIIETGKKKYIDYMYSVFETEYIEWFKQLEERCKEMLIEKSDEWFSNIEKDDIEHFFISSIRPYKTNKTLIRSHLYTGDSVNRKCTVFDENKIQTKYEDVIGKRINSIVHIKGIRFTSSSFQLDIETKQILIQEDSNIFNQCLMTDIGERKQEQEQDQDQEQLNQDISSAPKIDKANEISQECIHIEMEKPLEIIRDKQDNENTISDNKDIHDKPTELANENKIVQETQTQETQEDVNDVEDVEDVKNVKGVENVKDVKVDSQVKMENMQTTDTVECIESPDVGLEEVELDFTSLQEDKDSALKLVDPNTIYKEMYRKAKRKMRETRKQAIKAYLEADQMKNQYNISSSENDDESTNSEDDQEDSEMFMETIMNKNQY